MSDSIVVLVCAVVASLASGVLVAYGVCVTMFRIFEVKVEQAAIASGRAVVVPPPVSARIVEG